MDQLYKSRTIEEEQEFVRVLDGFHKEWATVMSQQKIDTLRHFFIAGALDADPKIEVHGIEIVSSEPINMKAALEAAASVTAPVSLKDYVQALGFEYPSILSMSEFLGTDVRLPVGPRLLRELEHRFPTEVRTNVSCTEAYIVTADSHYVDTYTIGYTYEKTAAEHVRFWLALNGKQLYEGETPMQCLEQLANSRK